MVLEARQRQLEQTISSLTQSLVDKQSTIDTLQLQVVIYREDFQSERQDRERAQSQIAELQAQLSELALLRQRATAAAAAAAAAPQVHKTLTHLHLISPRVRLQWALQSYPTGNL